MEVRFIGERNIIPTRMKAWMGAGFVARMWVKGQIHGRRYKREGGAGGGRRGD